MELGRAGVKHAQFGWNVGKIIQGRVGTYFSPTREEVGAAESSN